MGATETMRARAYDVATAAARFRLKAATLARETVRALDAGDLERACVLVSGARAALGASRCESDALQAELAATRERAADATAFAREAARS